MYELLVNTRHCRVNITFLAATSQNGQKQSNNSLAVSTFSHYYFNHENYCIIERTSGI